MIAQLSGVISHREGDTCVILTPGGTGYELTLTATALSRLGGAGEDVVVPVYQVVREDALDLYGFADFEERRYFRILLAIPKLGPKKALAILSAFSPEDLRTIAVREDVASMTTVSGIGKKSAQQIVWDLKHKLKDETAALPRPKGGGSASGGAGELLDTLAGLTGLGYSEDEVRPMVKEIFEAEPDQDAASAIRLVLKKIAMARS